MKPPAEKEEVIQELRRIDMSELHPKKIFCIGDMVKWQYEWIEDPQYGKIYIVVGYNSEDPSFIVTRVMDSLQDIREFHVSQLVKV